MDELKKMRNFNNTIKSYDDRVRHVSDLLSDLEVDELVRQSLDGNSFTYDNIEKNLEELGTYILESQDVESERKVEDSFYLNERRFNRGTIYKNSVYVEKSVLENLQLEDLTGIEDTLHNEYIARLFKDITNAELINILKNIDAANSLNNEFLKDYISFICEDVIDNCSSGKDLAIINLFTKGNSSRSISKKVNLQHTTINRRVAKLTK